MADDRPKLSQQELAEVLQRATERESREGPRSFDPAEVVQAGRELGLSPGTVEAEMKALIARKQALPERERPFDTAVTVDSSGDRFQLAIPARGVTAAALGKGLFSVFWLGFVALWTGLAVRSGAPLFFPLFSLPFWATGIGLLGSSINSMIKRQRLDLDRTRGQLVTQPLGLRRPLHTRELRVRLERVQRRAGKSDRITETPVLVLEHGTRTITLLEGFSEAEQRWVKAELEHWLAG
jgi:eukaryotic-like serine/threonine-protein kinase